MPLSDYISGDSYEPPRGSYSEENDYIPVDKVLSMDENADRVEELEEELEEAEKRYKAAPETVTKMIRFREKFTFLNSPDCPDILKILVSDMFTAYGKYKEAFARLEVTPDDVSSLSTARKDFG